MSSASSPIRDAAATNKHLQLAGEFRMKHNMGSKLDGIARVQQRMQTGGGQVYDLPGSHGFLVLRVRDEDEEEGDVQFLKIEYFNNSVPERDGPASNDANFRANSDWNNNDAARGAAQGAFVGGAGPILLGTLVLGPVGFLIGAYAASVTAPLGAANGAAIAAAVGSKNNYHPTTGTLEDLAAAIEDVKGKEYSLTGWNCNHWASHLFDAVTR